ncbi:MAG TPA: TonB family protein [Azospira sp.]|nr:TonB family protein [Azospira sp.]
MPTKRLTAAFLVSFLVHALVALAPGPATSPSGAAPALQATLRPQPQTPATIAAVEPVPAPPPEPEPVPAPPPPEPPPPPKKAADKPKPPAKMAQAAPRFREPASFNGYPVLQGSAAQSAFSQLSRQPLYPAEAIAQGLEGEVLLLLFLDAAGNVMAARVERSSGYAVLDQAAVTAARRLKALPEGAPREAVLPVRFRLQ